MLVLGIAGALRLHMMVASPVIIGAGPTGLTAAIMLARRGYKNIVVFDRLEKPPAPDAALWTDFTEERSYNIGLSSRGQTALLKLDALDGVIRYTADAVGRKDWSPNSPDEPKEELYRGRSFPTRVLQRDRLTGALLEEIETKYSSAVSVRFNVECLSAAWVGAGTPEERCRLTLRERGPGAPLLFYEESPLVLGADGAASAVRDAMTRRSSAVRVTRLPDRTPRVYRTIPLHFPASWRRDLNYSVRLRTGLNLEALPTREGVYLAVLIYRPGDPRLAAIHSATDARAFFNTHFPMYKDCLREEDLARFADKSDSFFPKFSFTGPALHCGSTALLGDCIHSVKPFFALGANSALEDVLQLDSALAATGDRVQEALALYSRSRGADARAMVQLAARLDGGFLGFVLPLLVDSALHRLLPAVFSPNTLASLNNEKRTFAEIQRRKALDRVMQLVLGSTLVAALVRVIRAIPLRKLGAIVSKIAFRR